MLDVKMSLVYVFLGCDRRVLTELVVYVSLYVENLC